jgi:hypothetical protein
MKLTLNIKEDKELRDYIKDMIKGQIMSIARKEIRGLVMEALSDRIKNINTENTESIMKKEIERLVYRELTGSTGWNKPNYIKEQARILINDVISKQLRDGAV